jgi:hypothetical protein
MKTSKLSSLGALRRKLRNACIHALSVTPCGKGNAFHIDLDTDADYQEFGRIAAADEFHDGLQGFMVAAHLITNVGNFKVRAASNVVYC